MRKMCFLVAKQFNQIGCFALQTEGGKPLVEMKRRLENEFGDNSLQLVTISRPSAYGEYEPYSFVSSGIELRDRLKENMVR
jgi:hypothetical protein